MDKDHQQTPSKKAYIPPKITKINLVAEEAVLAGCKNSGGVRPDRQWVYKRTLRALLHPIKLRMRQVTFE